MCNVEALQRDWIEHSQDQHIFILRSCDSYHGVMPMYHKQLINFTNDPVTSSRSSLAFTEIIQIFDQNFRFQSIVIMDVHCTDMLLTVVVSVCKCYRHVLYW